MKAIEVVNLSKHFVLSKKSKKKQNKSMHRNSEKNDSTDGLIKAVDTINFSINRGEIFGLLGPNGAGKTTTIRMLTGILKPTNGKIIVFNKELNKNRILVQQIMGHVPELSNVYLDLTGMQNLELMAELYGISRKDRKNKAELLLEKFDLLKWKDSKAKKYSKGMKQRLLLCMALISDPEILFLDEPTSGLDVQSSIIIKQLIKEYHASGMTIILTTHDMDVANELCNRIAIMNKGIILGLDKPQDLRRLKQDYQAIDVYITGNVKIHEIEDLPNIKQVQKKRDFFHIIVNNLKQAISEIVEYIECNDLQLEKLNTYEPQLEEVFLKMINGEKT
ncbi:MAG: ATP-binding cassette domain-containing protein [Asgard group archaeon]|nr:ATP-binding cassette domain-containing protein [Asgard group archaeon]